MPSACATGGTETGGTDTGGGETGGDGDGETGGTGGDTGGTETGGMGGVPFSCEECPNDKQVCDEEAEECFACTAEDDTHCPATAPVCSPKNDCVQCTTEDATACAPETPVCNDENECVECVDNTHCTDAAASSCNDANECEQCQNDSDCEHLGDLGICAGGTCVECTVERDDPMLDTDPCGAHICDPQTNTCDRTRTQADKDVCEPCIADSECEEPENHHCVPMNYNDEERGGYCLQTVEDGCRQPFRIETGVRESLSGVGGHEYCAINETLTTCDAVRALIDNVACDDAVGSSDCPEGGLCRKVANSADLFCTYQCSGPVECDRSPRPGDSCGPGDAPYESPEYCGGKD